MKRALAPVLLASVCMFLPACSNRSDGPSDETEPAVTSRPADGESTAPNPEASSVPAALPSDQPANAPPAADATPEEPSDPAAADADQPEDNAQAADSPEAVLRSFLISLIDQDEEALTKLILPNPEADVLWSGERLPTLFSVAAKLQLRVTKLRRLAVGETVTLPGGQTMVLDEIDVNDDRVHLTAKNNPIPFVIVRQPDGWKLDAGPIIAARKAARAVKEAADGNAGTE